MLFKIHINIFTVCVGKSTFVLLTLLFWPWVLRLATVVAGVRGGDRITKWTSAGQESNWRLWRCILAKQFRLCQSGDSGLTLKMLTTRNYKRQESVIHGRLRKYQGSEHDVCALVNSKWLDFSKRSCFLKLRFGVSSLSSSFPPILHVTRRITRKAGYTLNTLFFSLHLWSYKIVTKWRHKDTNKYPSNTPKNKYGPKHVAEVRFLINNCCVSGILAVSWYP